MSPALAIGAHAGIATPVVVAGLFLLMLRRKA